MALATSTIQGEVAPVAPRTWYASLEGIRGWGFLLVCTFHYGGAFDSVNRHGRWLYPWFVANQLGWLAVPLFFVLSGFLITGILYDTRDRARYFQTFYLRRVVRIFPLYYVVLAATAVAALLLRYPIPWKYASYLVYLDNFSVQGSIYYLGSRLELGHLWSLAVEEQFYLVWPVVVWLCRDRAQLLKICYAILAGCFLLRVAWPLLHLPILFAYYCTFTRADSLILGGVLALYQRTPGFQMRHLSRVAGAVVVGGILVMVLKTVLNGQALPFDYWGVVILIPLVNLICAGILILAVQPGTWMNRVCSQNWACRVGQLSYGMYVLHLIYRPWFEQRLAPFLALRIGSSAARLSIVCLAFALTYVLASLTYRYIEAPALRWKNKLQYGPKRLSLEEVADSAAAVSLSP